MRSIHLLIYELEVTKRSGKEWANNKRAARKQIKLGLLKQLFMQNLRTVDYRPIKMKLLNINRVIKIYDKKDNLIDEIESSFLLKILDK